LFALQGVATGLILPFTVPILRDRGFRADEIGLVLGASAVAAVAAFPLAGYLADARLGRLRVLRWSSVAAAAAGLAFAALGATDRGGELALAALAVAAISVGTASWGPVADALALEGGGVGPGRADYGLIRRWTSIGWVVAALCGGAAYAALGPSVPPLAFAAASLAVGAAALGDDRAPAGTPTRDGRQDPAPARPGAGEFVRLVRRSPIAIPFLLGLVLVSAGGSAANGFVPLRILDTGGGPFLVGLASALPALVEIPFFSRAGDLAARIGLRGLFAVGAAIGALQLALFAVAPDPRVVAAIRTADGAAFALRYSAIVLIVGGILPARFRAMGQAGMWLVVGGLVPIVAGPVGGRVYEAVGGPALFAGGAAVSALGIAIAVASLRRLGSVPVGDEAPGRDGEARSG
ncbi:MAG: hypothetical protein RL338_1751, partial [Chloroflexota bacterium]